MKKILSVSVAILAMGLVACGDPSSTGNAEGISSGEVNSSTDQSSGTLASSGKASSGTSGSSSATTTASSGSVYWNTNLPYGTLEDDRDDKTYRTIEIGTQTWMAENLNYSPELGYSWCYDRKPANCDIYGRLYDWTTAQTVCPDGWSLPDSSDWSELVKYAGGKVSAGVKLKAKTSLWSMDKGTDAFGFAAIPSGLYDGDLYFDLGVTGTWWTATSVSNTEAITNDMLGTSAAIRSSEMLKTTGVGIRCILDDVVSSSSVKLTSSVVASSSSVAPSSVVVSSSVTPVSSSSIIIKLSVIVLSSSVAPSSSSISSSTCSNVYGTNTVKDCRDGITYKTVVISGQTWLAQNLNYKMNGSHCYKEAAACDVYGQMYDWVAANKACPINWHLPDSTEWNALITYAGGATTGGKKLKSTSTLWKSGGQGTDTYGFTALPGGKYYDIGKGVYEYTYQTDSGYWWTSSPVSSTTAVRRSILWGADAVYSGAFNKNERVSVRCIRN